jgi:RsiW-degrading membrane proteinase PrsW (M82 family)
MGTLSYLFAIFISILSSIIFIVAILHSDKESKEPNYMIALALLSGIFTIAVSLIVGQLILPKLNFLNGESYNFIKVLIFAFVEETAKIIVLYFCIQRNSNFDDIYDGFVYSSLIALSFGAFESVLYVLNETNLSSMINLALIRGITTIPLHLICGTVMGYYVGTEKFTRKKSLRMFKLFNAILLPTIVHTIYNYGLTQILSFFNTDLPFIITLVIFFIPFYIVGITYINRTKMVNEKFINNKYVIGLITKKEYDKIIEERY